MARLVNCKIPRSQDLLIARLIDWQESKFCRFDLRGKKNTCLKKSLLFLACSSWCKGFHVSKILASQYFVWSVRHCAKKFVCWIFLPHIVWAFLFSKKCGDGQTSPVPATERWAGATTVSPDAHSFVGLATLMPWSCCGLTNFCSCRSLHKQGFLCSRMRR